ncbi:MAG: hypothetical protein R3E08_05875 [Thiotrichaceae bacterium]
MALKSGFVAGNVDVIATVAVENEKSISTSASYHCSGVPMLGIYP